ncbi:MAG: hypothetical protein E7211_19315 [Clostridium lundense]|jgi:hypothetical protein|nr:hypothetical protein [Clostridium lundense]
MISVEQLEKMKYVVLDTDEISALPDISNVSIHGDTPGERLENLLEQIGNPYFFKVGTTPVRVSFNTDGKPLEEMLKSHFLGLKQKS